MKLLLAIDVHDPLPGVFEQAVAWARRLGGTLDLVYVNAFGDYLPYLNSQTLTVELQGELERIREQEMSQLDALLNTVPESQRGTAHVLLGAAAPSILELAPGYDALLVTTHGRTGLAHLWMGSVAEQLVRRSPVPIVVLRPKSQE